MDHTVMLILSLSISGGIVALLLFALKPLMKNRIPKSFQYYIWIVVLLRLALPLTFETSLMNFIFSHTKIHDPLLNIVQPAQEMNTLSTTIFDNSSISPHQETAAAQTTIPSLSFTKLLLNNMLLLWMLGAVLSFSWSLLGYSKFMYYIKKSKVLASESELLLLNQLLRAQNSRRKVTLYRSRFAPTPMLVGIIRPQIILPNKPYHERHLNHILLHELTHMKRFDIAIKWFVTIITAAHWFNPVVYFIRREIIHACELSCDEAVIKTLTKDGKQSYGETLISVIADSRHPASFMSATMSEDKRLIKERLVSIMRYKRKTKVVITLSVVFAATIIGLALALGASIGAKPPEPVAFLSKEFPDYNLDLLQSHKNSTLGDFKKIEAIAQLLPVPESKMKYDRISIKTDREPFGLTIYYVPAEKITEYPMDELENPRSDYYNLRDKNILILFSLINDLGNLSFNTDYTTINNGNGVMTVPRTNYEQWLSQDLWANEFTKLIEIFNLYDKTRIDANVE